MFYWGWIHSQNQTEGIFESYRRLSTVGAFHDATLGSGGYVNDVLTYSALYKKTLS